MKYKVEVITKQRNVIEIEANNEIQAMARAEDTIEAHPEGYLTGVYDLFILAPDHTVTEIK